MGKLIQALIGDGSIKTSPLMLTKDLVRLSLGRPTSAQVAQARREAEQRRIEAKEQRRQAKLAVKREQQEELRLRRREDRQARRRLKYEDKRLRRDGSSVRGEKLPPLVTAKPFVIDNIELTNRCPMRCVMCPRTKHMTRSQGYMDFEVFEKVIDEYLAVNMTAAREDGVYLHHFGESIMHPDFDRFIRHANERRVATRISINPLMLKERNRERLLAADPAMIMISLDGHDDESFYRIRGVKNAYRLSVERLHAFLRRKVESGNRSKVELSMIDFAANAESIDELRDYWGSVEGIDEFVIKSFTTWDGSAPEINGFSSLLVDNEARRKAHSRPACNMPWRKLTVTWDGDVVPCCYDYNKKLVLGNVRHQSLSEIWNGPMMQALRQEFNSNQVSNALCRNCAALYGD